jgi:hypothetical protein
LSLFQKSHLKNWLECLQDGLGRGQQDTLSIKSNLIDKQIVLQFYWQQKVHFCITPKNMKLIRF